jgi:hypothetical protein
VGESTGQVACEVCEQPKKDDDELSRCPICFKSYCRDCAYLFSGRTFCSQHCGEYFFFANPEDEEV